MRKIIDMAHSISREELAGMAYQASIYYHQQMIAKLSEVLIIAEDVEFFDKKRNEYLLLGDQIANNDTYYTDLVTFAAWKANRSRINLAALFTVQQELIAA